jgi:hypothetical protein
LKATPGSPASIDDVLLFIPILLLVAGAPLVYKTLVFCVNADGVVDGVHILRAVLALPPTLQALLR